MYVCIYIYIYIYLYIYIYGKYNERSGRSSGRFSQFQTTWLWSVHPGTEKRHLPLRRLNAYSAQAGTRVIRFKLATEGWLDPGTVRVFMDVVNADQTNDRVLRPIGMVHACFRRLRITTRGVVIEDISDYARVHEIFDTLSTPQARKKRRASDTTAQSLGVGGAGSLLHRQRCSDNWRLTTEHGLADRAGHRGRHAIFFKHTAQPHMLCVGW
jgi:hypothetical protein